MGKNTDFPWYFSLDGKGNALKKRYTGQTIYRAVYLYDLFAFFIKSIKISTYNDKWEKLWYIERKQDVFRLVQ